MTNRSSSPCACAFALAMALPTVAAATPPRESSGFSLSAEQGALADTPSGRLAPVATHGALVTGAGRFGRALRLGAAGGGGELEYPLRGCVDFARPGSLRFWVRPADWSTADAAYVPFVRAASPPAGVFVVERNTRAPGGGEDLLVGFFGIAGGRERYVSLRSAVRWGAADWHFVAVSWDARGFAASLDGQPLVREAVPEGWIARAFPTVARADGRWLVGDLGRASTWIDELAVAPKPLSDADIRRLFATPPR